MNERGQGVVEWTLVVFLVVFVFWVALSHTNVGVQVSALLERIQTCIGDFSQCSGN